MAHEAILDITKECRKFDKLKKPKQSCDDTNSPYNTKEDPYKMQLLYTMHEPHKCLALKRTAKMWMKQPFSEDCRSNSRLVPKHIGRERSRAGHEVCQRSDEVETLTKELNVVRSKARSLITKLRRESSPK